MSSFIAIFICACNGSEEKSLPEEPLAEFEITINSDSENLQILLSDYDLQKTIIDTNVSTFPIKVNSRLPLNSYKYGKIIGLKNSATSIIISNDFDNKSDTTTLPPEADTVSFNFTGLIVDIN